MKSCLKTEGKCRESVSNEIKIMRKSSLLHQIMRVNRGKSRDSEKGALYVGHHGWPAKKTLGFT